MAEQSGHQVAFGIDIGGSGIKGAPVDLTTGEFAADRLRIPTPSKSTPDAVADVLAELVAGFDLPDEAPVGVAFPAPLDRGIVRFIANLHKSWKGVDLPQLVREATGRDVTAVNDADAAGVGEDRYGAAAGHGGVVLMATLGTGIGSALLVDGVLVPNTELGHLEIDGHDAETKASEAARDREDLSWEKWAKRLQRYFETVEMLLSPDLIVVGGGVSKHHQKFLPLLDLRAEIVPATLRNRAGIVGAASLAADPH
ncbi:MULTISPECIES: polyphosphate--glucose phosphotransferase [Isoptericola]|uniref:ROK family protein n=1 Tax=Isoptericola sediminis TaxID=2733572 RepID=A0A849K6D4_9MICO|nr:MULTISPECIES: ROK family protein [Isoptericola]MDO8145264.1 ROK family protein [Isoptericola sp. 178]MDO8148900.1 ROK family protein [Isoptericola sp. b515]MDO8151157.1 ROK family protein [Isoptericola sp. b408]NNU28501.1 ROK family protein [Isoptericola sediminis]